MENNTKPKIKSELHQDSFWISIMFKISIIFFKLIGLAAFAHYVVTDEKRTSHTFQDSKFGTVYNVVLSSLMIASNYISIPFCINREYYSKTNLVMSIKFLQTVLGTLVICIILLNYCIHQKSLMRIVNRLMDVEYEINHLYDLHHPLRRQRIFCIMIVVCTLNICLLIFVLFTEIKLFQFLHINPISWLTDVLPTFYIGWLLIQYFLLLTIVQADFADVNRVIQNLTRINTSDLRSKTLCQMRRIVISNSTVRQLRQLRDMHRYLCKISEDISDFYSLPVLFGITFLFLTFVYNGYYLFRLLTDLASDVLEYDFELTLISLFNIITWLIFLIYPISILTNRITTIIIEMEKTGNTIHNLLSYTIDKEMKSELKQFSLELLHCKIHFTANGYFTLDNRFLHSLIGTMVTYLVILVQLQMKS